MNTLNILVHLFWWKFIYTYIPVGNIGVEVLGHRVCVCSDLIEKPVFWSGWKHLHSHGQCVRVPTTPSLCQYLTFSAFFIWVIWVHMYWMCNLYFLDDSEPEYPFILLLVFVYLFLWVVFSSLLPMFLSIGSFFITVG